MPDDYQRLSSPLNGVKILAVDDHPDGLALVSRLLVARGALVWADDSAAGALDALAEFEPGVLISDVGMPGQDGYELIRLVRSGGRDAGRLPALALTAFAEAGDRTRCLLAGFQFHLAKPFDTEELIAVVATLAGRVRPD